MTSIIPLIIFFFLSLIGAFVLFKFVKSEAVIEKRKGFMSGGIAGFVIIFGLLANWNYFLRTQELENKWKPQSWTITGCIVKEGSESYKGIDVKYQPPSPALEIHQANGCFNLYRVMICEATKWPILQFECKGFFPYKYEIRPDNAIIDKNTMVVKLRSKISLEKI